MKALEVVNSTKYLIMNIQALELDMKLLHDQAAEVKCCSAFCEDVKTVLPKLAGCLKGLEKVQRTPSTSSLNLEEVTRLEKQVLAVQQQIKELKEFGAKLVPAKAKKSTGKSQ